MALASLWGDFGVMLGSLWASGSALGSHGGISGSVQDHFAFTLNASGGHCGHMNVASGHFGVALALRSPWVHF